jgi:hypothetical protein
MLKGLSNRFRRSSRARRRELAKLQATYGIDIASRRFEFDWRATNFNRIAVVNLLLADKPDGHYLEIGCANNDLFDSVIAKHKVGVDPQQGGTHRLTSNEFFARNGGARYDVVFIDGLHTYEQTRQDVINALRCVGKNSWIALHDMFPRDWLEEHVPRISGGWNGDVWKVAFELASAPDIDFKLLKIDHGVGVLRVLKEGATIPDMQGTLGDKRFPYFYEHAATLPLVDYAEGRAWIEQGLSAARLQTHVQ